MIAVMGASGNVGSKVADLLVRQGQPVRALEHRRRLDELGRRGAEVVGGDLADPGDLGLLLKDVDAALVVLPDVVTEPEFAATRSRMSSVIADALRASRVEHVVALSTVAAGRADAAGPAAGLRELEQRLAELQDRHVLVLRSPFYMENLLAGLPLIRAQGVNGSAIEGDLELPMIATRDVAREAAERLLRRDFSGHGVRLLVGPEDVSLRAATRALGRRLGLPELAYVQVPGRRAGRAARRRHVGGGRLGHGRAAARPQRPRPVRRRAAGRRRHHAHPARGATRRGGEVKGYQELRGRFRGALLRPGEEGYDEARRVWNGAIDRRPALIARCAGADDVAVAVRFAREHDLLVSVRGGGHAVAGHAVVDGGLMIDLSPLKAIRVDPGARTVRAAGGALLGELDRATQPFGLATPAGIVSHTGIGGLTLGGGLGYTMRRFGLTVDNLLAVDLVTADGEPMQVDAWTEPELFWGLRGGGGNFGVATAFTYRLHPVGPVVLGGPVFWPWPTPTRCSASCATSTHGRPTSWASS